MPSPVDPVDSAVVSPVLASPVLVPPVVSPLEPSPLELPPLELPPLELSPLEPSVALTAPVVPVLDASVGSPVAVALSVAPVIVASVLVGTTVVAALELLEPAGLPSVVPVPPELAASVLATSFPHPTSIPQPIAANMVRRIVPATLRRGSIDEPPGPVNPTAPAPSAPSAPHAHTRARAPRCAKKRPCA